MTVPGVDRANSVDTMTSGPSETTRKDSQNFEAMVDSAVREGTKSPAGAQSPGNFFTPGSVTQAKPVSTAPLKQATRAYSQQANLQPPSKGMSDWEKYKDDQLLRNPGGKNYDLEKKTVTEDSGRRQSFLDRVGKNVSDAFGNVKNFFANLFMGSKILYRDENNQIQEGRQRGLVGAVVDFFKDVGSALSFGYWRPSGEKEPQGFGARLGYTLSKLKDAITMDVVGGVSGSINHMSKNLILAGWNLVEVLPDATIGNFDAGRKLTTTIFDNGQVMIEYLTDVAPTGDAWLRVHSGSLKDMKLPIVYNIGMPERNMGDVRWQYVRNTPFRKTIETLGALLGDAATFGLLGQTAFSGKADNRHHELLTR